ncbi:protein DETOXIFICATION 14-like [Phalaenopsis equestris]|uniref:protein DETOXIFICATION 14-like n=1 Tax=Phalaenopsis equestris TaxID=78828 RepID=UPI0009E48E60|nr:protein DETOXIFICATION 14-like [Phalaenopsis equestris]
MINPAYIPRCKQEHSANTKPPMLSGQLGIFYARDWAQQTQNLRSPWIQPRDVIPVESGPRRAPYVPTFWGAFVDNTPPLSKYLLRTPNRVRPLHPHYHAHNQHRPAILRQVSSPAAFQRNGGRAAGEEGWGGDFTSEARADGGVTLLQYLVQVTSSMMVGHLGELALSGSAIATSLSTVTGFSLLLGMASGLETLCGQAYGAKRYKKLGIHTYRAILSLIIVCLPISLLWIYMGKLLSLIGQDPLISQEAGKYIAWMIPALFAYGTAQPLMKFFQSQSLTLPMLLSSFTTLCIHIPLCWAMVLKTVLGNVGAALSISISYWISVVILVMYIKFSDSKFMC